ncbi:hypothetical protein B484DRAFT_438431 [Ochromonadaceae sp. CCMP2298]|nr:hypothetical protein B484DRAFT_438431 [Ochromonadaceae sp. CCMP2298]
MSGRMMAHQKRPTSVWALAQFLSNRSRKERSNNQDGTMGAIEAKELVFLNEEVRAFYTNNISVSSYKDMRNQVLEAAGEMASMLKAHPECTVDGETDLFKLWELSPLLHKGSFYAYWGIQNPGIRAENFQPGESATMQESTLKHLLSLGVDQRRLHAPADTELENLDDEAWLEASKLHPIELKGLRRKLQEAKDDADRSKKLGVVTDKKKPKGDKGGKGSKGSKGSKGGGGKRGRSSSSKEVGASAEEDTDGDAEGDADEDEDSGENSEGKDKQRRKKKRLSSQASQNYGPGAGSLEHTFGTFVSDGRKEDMTTKRADQNQQAWAMVHDVDYHIEGDRIPEAVADVLKRAGVKAAGGMEYLKNDALGQLMALMKDAPGDQFLDLIKSAKEAAKVIKG